MRTKRRLSSIKMKLKSMSLYPVVQICKPGWAFRVGLGPGISGLIRTGDVLLDLGAQKYNQNNLATLAKFFRPDSSFVFVFFRHIMDFKLVFGFMPGLGVYLWVRAGFELELVDPFITLQW